MSDFNSLDSSQRDHARERFDDAVNKLHEIFQSFNEKTSAKRPFVREDELATLQLQIQAGASMRKQDDLLVNLEVLIRGGEYQGGVLVCDIKIMDRT